MKRGQRYALTLLVLLGLGYGAYVLGDSLRPQAELSGTVLQNPVDVSQVALTNAGGEQIALSGYAGQTALVFFGFADCPDVCPVTLSRLAKIYEDLGEPDDVQVVMITVNPAVDTPERTQRYASGFHPDFVGLSGNDTAIAEAAKTFFAGYSANGNEVVHTDYVFLVDEQGMLQAVYAQDALQNLESDLNLL